LCRICGWRRFFVETTGKNGMNSTLAALRYAPVDRIQ
jgi:hypothetical protein